MTHSSITVTAKPAATVARIGAIVLLVKAMRHSRPASCNARTAASRHTHSFGNRARGRGCCWHGGFLLATSRSNSLLLSHTTSTLSYRIHLAVGSELVGEKERRIIVERQPPLRSFFVFYL